MDSGKTSAITRTCETVASISSCLSELHAQAVEEERALPTSKALLLNLIVYAPDEASSERAMELVSRIVPSVPCRTIIAEIAHSMPVQGATVSVMCGISDRGDRRLCGEVINVHAARGTVTGSVLPLLIADVPVYLWVMGDIPPANGDFADLLSVSSHVIVDSRAFTDMSRSLKATDRLRTGGGDSRIVQDLAWMSLRMWREATASHFDAPSVRSYIAGVQNMDVAYSGSTGSPYPESAPLLFAAWFADRTGISVQRVFRSREEGFLLDGAQAGELATIRVVPEDSHRVSGEILSVRIDCRSGDERALFGTERVSDSEVAVTEECKEVCLPPKNIAVEGDDDAALAIRALRSYGNDCIYESALAVAVKTVAQIELADERASGLRL